MLLTVLFMGCSSITILRTKELNRVGDELDSSNTAKVKVLEARIDSLMGLVMAMQNVMVKFSENTKNMMRNDRIALNSSLDRLDRQLSYFEAKLEASEHQLKKINNQMGSLENKSVSYFDQSISDSLNADNIKSKELYELAYKDYLAQKYDLSLSEFKELYEKYPKSIYTDKTLYYLGLISQAKKDSDSALKYYDLLITDYPNASYIRSAYVKKGDILVALGKKEEGKKVYKIILEKYPMSPEASMVKEKLVELDKPITTVPVAEEIKPALDTPKPDTTKKSWHN